MSHVIAGDVWQGILRSIKSKLSQESFDTWFQPLAFEGLDESRRMIRLRAPNSIIKNWVNTNYSSLVDESLTEVRLDGYLIGWSADEVVETAGQFEARVMVDDGDNRSPMPERKSSISETIERVKRKCQPDHRHY